MSILDSLLRVGWLGIACISANTVGSVFIFKSKSNYPEDPSIVVHNRKTLWFIKIVFSLLMMSVSLIPPGNIPVISLFYNFVNMLGPLYFPIALVLDIIVYLALHSKEWCNQDLVIASNFMEIPLITLVAGCYVYIQSKKLGGRIKTETLKGVVLGHITMAIRRVTNVKIPETYLGTEMVLQSEKWEVRRTPRRTPYIYDPESRSNPHICITGSSGVGKTTSTMYIVSELLRRGYPVIIFDPKGDMSMTAMVRGWHAENEKRRKKVLILDVGSLGIDPLQPVSGESFMERITDLINAMSVVEEVGANQKYLIVRSAQEIAGKGKATYKALLEKIRYYVDSFLSSEKNQPIPRYGPHIRDAYMGIRSKMEILSTVFKENPRLNISILNPENWPNEENIAGILINLSKIRDRYARAVAMELLLRKLEQMLRERGPLAFLLKKKVFIVVDEAHELARSQRWREDVTTSILEDMAREARSHGAGLILVTQRLSDIPDGIRMNIGLWLSLRTDSPQDIYILKTVMPVGRLPEIVTSMPDGYALLVEALPQRLERMHSIPSKPVAVEEAYIIMLERRMAKIRESVEEAEQRLREAVEVAGRDVEKIMVKISQKLGEELDKEPDSREGEPELGKREEDANIQIDILDGEDIVSRTMRRAYLMMDDEEKREKFLGIPRDVVEKYIGSLEVKPRELPLDLKELFIQYDLLRKKEGRVVSTVLGDILKRAYMEVARNG
ncbi:MAG: ATP-binding protein [Desulfurococcaceae archaeon]